MTPTFERIAFTAEIQCNYLLRVPVQASASPVVAIALHGYGQTPETMLRLTSQMLQERAIIASVAAPFQFYAAQGPGGVAGYNWGVRDHWDEAVRLHHYIVDSVSAQLHGRFGVTADRILLVGFSQPVGLNYRYIGTRPNRVGGVIGLCGGVPKDWEEGKYQSVSTPILHISRDEDEYFPVETVNGYPARLRLHATDVEFHLLPGGHRFPSKAGHVVDPWLARVFGV